MSEGKKSTVHLLDDFPPVDIDPDGVFKYVLIELNAEDENGKEVSKLLVRGYK